ncbi:hypothetical protein F5Y05DRAFT_417436 [Hypoxylon sp. FL0543]|nr:hypothetical protein F5Y05DRAFT_417436 [Hypoxylon sp. FL0543]
MQDSARTFEGLPPELKNKVISKLPDAHSVFNLALTGPVFYNHIFHDDDGANERTIASDIVVAQVGSTLLPMAIARYEASIISWKRDLSSQAVPMPLNSSMLCENIVQFSNEHLEGQHAARVKKLPARLALLPIAKDLLSCHEAIQHYAAVLSIKAATSMPSRQHRMNVYEAEDIIPNDREKLRFSKALYIFQVISELFMVNTTNPIIWRPEDTGFSALAAFWRKFAPWENQQVRCIQRLLMDHIQPPQGAFIIAPRSRLWKFVVAQGPSGLYDIYHRQRFSHHNVNFTYLCWPRFIFAIHILHSSINDLVWYPSDTLWLNFTSQATQFNRLYILDAAHLLREFPEGDSGPAYIWYHMLCQNALPPQADGVSVFQAKHSFTRCENCLTNWGFPFWDRQKFDRYSSEEFPSMEAMQNALRDDFGDRLSFRAVVINVHSRPNTPRFCRCSGHV